MMLASQQDPTTSTFWLSSQPKVGKRLVIHNNFLQCLFSTSTKVSRKSNLHTPCTDTVTVLRFQILVCSKQCYYFWKHDAVQTTYPYKVCKNKPYFFHTSCNLSTTLERTHRYNCMRDSHAELAAILRFRWIQYATQQHITSLYVSRSAMSKGIFSFATNVANEYSHSPHFEDIAKLVSFSYTLWN